MTSINYYPKNFHANGWGWHRPVSTAAAVRGFLKKERGGPDGPAFGNFGNFGNGSLYPKLPSEDDTVFSTGGARLYPSLPVEDYGTGEVQEIVEEACESVNVSAVMRRPSSRSEVTTKLVPVPTVEVALIAGQTKDRSCDVDVWKRAA
ncbi:hypothetical protein EVAR_12169_1 [Eumeta japonica]|uniref:Uncharacterized protein n=1 Tax=Eumeta variegata TaxID=151549 RepID=A0A4C1UGX1_EUMVA|nr:hypothetical protein EVAR_12169_1 [Eumeta japonica]